LEQNIERVDRLIGKMSEFRMQMVEARSRVNNKN